MFEWRSRDIHNIQDNSLIDEFIGLEREMEKSWYSLRQVMKLNSKYFGHIGEVNKETFYWSYEFVMTRCFGYSLPSTSLVALADMFNHCH